ncbi:MAG: hypothetical protein RDV48_10170 [Candidatus Eremiobacteraeota bacterium]|nr:hypothetical protein [Candidatus Eremiobacteraeota bacterium]
MVPRCAATCIGSFPHTSAEALCRFITDTLPEVPLWPQLPRRSFYEGMYVQFTEHLPLADLDGDEKKIFFRSPEGREEEIEEFYERSLDEDLSYFSISPSYAEGLSRFAELSEKIRAMKPLAIKGQVTGPVSFGLTVTDKERKPIYYNAQMREIIVIGLKMKALWELQYLSSIYEKIILFIDEPYLTSIGSGVISLKPGDVVSDLQEFTGALREHYPSVRIGMHCCGNTDWSLIMKTGVDILSFDAYTYGENLLVYEGELKEFLGGGGMLAWGIVPTAGEEVDTPVPALMERMEALLALCGKKGFDIEKLLEHSFVTPSCGMTTLDERLADRLIENTASLSAKLRKKYFS